VAYLLDGRHRLDVFDRKGLASLAWSLWHVPPHSPWSTITALIGFSIFGVQAWAPYAMNALLVVGLLCAADHFLGLRNLWPRVLVSLAILALPMTFRAVHEFRPDFAEGLATAAACLFTIRMGVPGTSPHADWKRCGGAGLFFGLPLLIKPSFVFHTTALLVVSLALSEQVRFMFAREPVPFIAKMFPGLLGRAGSFLGGAILVAGPYYARAWKEVMTYIGSNTG
jgi:hypothetical protein